MTKVEIFLEVHNWIYLKIYKKVDHINTDILYNR